MIGWIKVEDRISETCDWVIFFLRNMRRRLYCAIAESVKPIRTFRPFVWKSLWVIASPEPRMKRCLRLEPIITSRGSITCEFYAVDRYNPDNLIRKSQMSWRLRMPDKLETERHTMKYITMCNCLSTASARVMTSWSVIPMLICVLQPSTSYSNPVVPLQQQSRNTVRQR